MLIEAIDERGTSGGAMGKVPINEESLKRPMLGMCYILCTSSSV
jgi:hypothetical protein